MSSFFSSSETFEIDPSNWNMDIAFLAMDADHHLDIHHVTWLILLPLMFGSWIVILWYFKAGGYVLSNI